MAKQKRARAVAAEATTTPLPPALVSTSYRIRELLQSNVLLQVDHDMSDKSTLIVITIAPMMGVPKETNGNRLPHHIVVVVLFYGYCAKTTTK